MNNVFPGAIVRPTVYYGYPTVSAPRRVKASILGVIHTTETTDVPMPGSTHSWTFSVERDGTVHQFMDPVIAAPWTNGDIKSPDTSNPLIKAMVGSKYNPNEFCFITIENVNRIADGQRLTPAQLEANRRILLWGSKLSGLPMDRQHVIGHYQVNGETRVNCPTVPADRPRVFNGILAVMPDTATSIPGENMDIKGSFIGHVINRITTIVGEEPEFSNARLTPSVKEDNDPQALPAGTAFVPIIEVLGLDGDEQHWFLGVNYYKGLGWQARYVRGDQLVQPFKSNQNAGFTQAQVDAAAKTAEDKGVTEGVTQEKDRLRKVLGL